MDFYLYVNVIMSIFQTLDKSYIFYFSSLSDNSIAVRSYYMCKEIASHFKKQ